jgi:hypothetical protein
MTEDIRTGEGSLRFASAIGMVLTVTAGVALARWIGPAISERVDAAHARSPQIMAQRALTGSLIVFEFAQTDATKDQITIIFSNTPIDLRRPPRPVFGADIVEEFTFSGRDYQKGTVNFSRRVRDKSFLDSRYIRVVNHGTNPWSPSTISVTIDGQRLLDNVSMFPRKGRDPRGGLVRWNADDWDPVFWESEFRYRPKAY